VLIWFFCRRRGGKKKTETPEAEVAVKAKEEKAEIKAEVTETATEKKEELNTEAPKEETGTKDSDKKEG
jgi:hypothetical protein